MATTKRRTMIVATVGVWLAAVGSAAALTYNLNRPPILGSQPPAPRAPAGASLGLEELQSASPVLYVPTMTIVGAARHRPARAHAPSIPRDISEMRCGDPRELDLGSGHVQVCE